MEEHNIFNEGIFFKSREYLNFGRDKMYKVGKKKLRKHLLRLGDGLNTFGHDSQIFLTLKMVQH